MVPAPVHRARRAADVPAGAPEKMAMRCREEDLDRYLVEVRGYKPAYGTYRCGVGTKPAEPSAWEKAAKAEAILEKLTSQLGIDYR